MIRERANNGIPGLPMLLVLILADAALMAMLVMNVREENAPEIVFAALGIVVTTFLMLGLFMVNPNEGKVLQLFGAYKGTAKIQGLRWANPFLMKKKVSLRVRNFESSPLNVDDSDGKTIECTPSVFDGVMYVTTGEMRLVALNAATGEELWQFDPQDHA